VKYLIQMDGDLTESKFDLRTFELNLDPDIMLNYHLSHKLIKLIGIYKFNNLINTLTYRMVGVFHIQMHWSHQEKINSPYHVIYILVI
jgi:hypothetical protein